MSPVVGALQLYDYEVALPVDRQQVDPPPRVLPVSELLGDDEQVVVENADVVPQQPLQICALVQPQHAEGLALMAFQPIASDLVKRHETPSRLNSCARSCHPEPTASGRFRVTERRVVYEQPLVVPQLPQA